MGKVMRRWVCGVCAATLLVGLLGCNKKEEVKTTGATPTPKVEKKEEPTKVKILASNSNREVPNVSSSMEIPLVKIIGEKSNTIIDLQLVDHNKYKELVRMKFASGEFPDIYQAWEIKNEEVVQNDQVEDLVPLLDKYGPNLKKNIPQMVWDSVTLGGKIVAVPSPQALDAPAERVIYVRGDWMKKAGVKEIPKTSDELLSMWKAFRDSDFNGNGQKDEIPFSAREKFSWMDNIFGMWGVNLDNYALVDGKIMPGFAAPNVKKGIEFITEMYKEKLLDSEFLTNTGTIWQNKIQQNKVGSFNHTVGNAGAWYTMLRDANPNADVGLITIPTPLGKGYTGAVGRVQQPMLTSHFIMKGSKVKEAAMRVLDYLGTPEGSTLCKFGIEGDSLVKDTSSDSYIFDSDKMKANKTQWAASALAKINLNIKIKSKDPAQDDFTNRVAELSKKEGIPNPVAAMPMPATLLAKADLQWGGPIIQEAIAKIVFGEKPLSYYDEVLDKWKKSGGDDVIKEATDWYNKYGKK